MPGSGPIDGLIGDVAGGDRVLFVGDATLASAAPPADIRVCDALTLFGWDAEIDTSSGDGLGFVDDILDDRLADDDIDWDVLALFVGNQLPLDELSVDELTEALDRAIERVAPRPVMIYTISERDRFQRQFNEVIRSRPDVHDNVAVVDWAELGGPAGEVLQLDGVTLTDDGLKRFALYTAQQMGQAPDDQDGDCLESVFSADDE